MSYILIDTSVWIAYFRGDDRAKILNDYIDSNRISTNDIILSELLPSILFQEKHELADILKTIHTLPLEINWEEIRRYQLNNMLKGINKVGIPDIIILQNAITNDAELLTRDKHFRLMANHINCKVTVI